MFPRDVQPARFVPLRIRVYDPSVFYQDLHLRAGVGAAAAYAAVGTFRRCVFLYAVKDGFENGVQCMGAAFGAGYLFLYPFRDRRPCFKFRFAFRA